MKDFRDLIVWAKAHQFTLAVYALTKGFPKDESYGLTSQLRRSAASIPTNLAEGCGRGTDRELARFCDIAMGSASEADYQLLLAKDLGYIDSSAFDLIYRQLTEIQRMLRSFIQRLRSA
ncbi:four helix bundle protein [Rhodopirellula baltica]|uniref:23S rRNA-associated protein n=2 Tax=Rhodopirellula baltica TaxID=265606 RepID=F2B0H1_RHOBT|nr:four helix bundle protein [Rhodopirellula baltica]EGF24603.1 23S rRNA-associated protein [Rhodopirellula baltica WH47]EKK01860.1 23S rRNA-associated protein [Rhodopirellula baltica SH28]